MNKQFIKQYFLEIIFFSIFLFFSIWLMFSTFSYKNGSMLIATKAWSDFANHIPLIRSFSFGNNFPPQDPLFSGGPIHYHFLFYLFVGILEKIGIRIDYALNIPSTLGFFALLIVVYIFAKKLFHSKAVALLSILFFIFNGSLSFIEFFKQHPLTSNTLQTMLANTTFPSFGPYDQKIVSAFWNLNIYTNQRHLAAAYALAFFLLYMLLFHCYDKAETTHKISHKKFYIPSWKEILLWIKSQIKYTNLQLSILLGVILGASFFFHLAAFLMIVIIIVCFFFLFSNLRLASFIILLVAGIIAFPQYLYLRSGGSGFSVSFVPGYLASNHLTISYFFIYWFYNLGLHFILISIGFILAPQKIKKIFIAFLSLFFIGNLFQFAPEMAGNHKFFNLFLLFGNMLSAYALVTFWQKSIFARPCIIVITFFLLLSGIIDFFPVYNDSKVILADYPVNADIKWIMQHTHPDTTILNTTYLYDTANIAGRKIFLGWPYFPWSAGFDTTTRSNQIKQFFASQNTQDICKFLDKQQLDYVELTTPTQDFSFNEKFWGNNFLPIYSNSQTHLRIYKTSNICKNM